MRSNFAAASESLPAVSRAPPNATESRMSTNPPTPWHVLTAAQAAAQFGLEAGSGPTCPEAVRRLSQHGRNAWQMLLSQIADFMILLLLGAAVVSGVIGEIEDAAAILAIVVLNAIIGFVQDYRAEKGAARTGQPIARIRIRWCSTFNALDVGLSTMGGHRRFHLRSPS